MILTPFDLTAIAPIAALIPPRIQEPPVAAPTAFAARLAGFGFYGPFRVRPADPVIEDRAGHPMIMVLPVIDGPADKRLAAEIACIALNRLCGFSSVAERPDTIELPGAIIRQQVVPALPNAAE